MLTFAKLNSYGRLANQVIQAMALIGIAHKVNHQALLPGKWKYRQHFNIPDRYFNKVVSEQDIMPVPNKSKIEQKFEYDMSIFENLNPNHVIDIEGCFQSEKYWSEIRDEIRPWFLLKNQTWLDEWSVGVHIRRGDYETHGAYINLPPEYYLSAIEKYFADPHFHFHITPDDREYARLHFPVDKMQDASEYMQFHLSEGTAIDDLRLLTGCRHLIMSNSSYSWLAGYLGELRPNDSDSAVRRMIIRPPKIFKGQMDDPVKYNEKDFWLPQWTIHDWHANKIDLRDVTFIIPVKYDHDDRKANLNLSIYMLQKAFDTHIIVGELNGKHFDYTAQYGRYMNFGHASLFHRTRILNEMTLAAETPIVVNWDADVVTPPAALLEMAKMLRAGYDFVYPYDGRFARVDRREMAEVIKFGDIGMLKGKTFPGMQEGHVISLGGAVGYRKASFIGAGLENENMVSFAPEDTERFLRFKRLMYKVGRTHGVLYHFNHYTGADSNKAHAAYPANEAELKRIDALDLKALISDVRGWEWRKKAVLGGAVNGNH